jgi:hypothetical protein
MGLTVGFYMHLRGHVYTWYVKCNLSNILNVLAFSPVSSSVFKFFLSQASSTKLTIVEIYLFFVYLCCGNILRIV